MVGDDAMEYCSIPTAATWLALKRCTCYCARLGRLCEAPNRPASFTSHHHTTQVVQRYDLQNIYVCIHPIGLLVFNRDRHDWSGVRLRGYKQIPGKYHLLGRSLDTRRIEQL